MNGEHKLIANTARQNITSINLVKYVPSKSDTKPSNISYDSCYYEITANVSSLNISNDKDGVRVYVTVTKVANMNVYAYGGTDAGNRMNATNFIMWGDSS